MSDSDKYKVTKNLRFGAMYHSRHKRSFARFFAFFHFAFDSTPSGDFLGPVYTPGAPNKDLFANVNYNAEFVKGIRRK